MKSTARASNASCCSAHVRAAMRARISIYDVAVFLRDMPDRMVEMNRLADLSTAILDETSEFIHAMRIARVPITTSACR
jgi:hypothetical protein